MNPRRFTSAAPAFSAELAAGLQDIGCHELAQELRALDLVHWTCDAATGAVKIQLAARAANVLDDPVVATGFGRSLALRLRGPVLVELDDFGRLVGLELFGREDVARELRAQPPVG